MNRKTTVYYEFNILKDIKRTLLNALSWDSYISFLDDPLNNFGILPGFGSNLLFPAFIIYYIFCIM